MMDTIFARLRSDLALKARQRAKAFAKEEEGSMIVFTLFLLVLMLIVSGMAVDFMRFESRRAELQGVVDRAVLAAADLDQELDPAAVVTDYFDKAGMLNQLKGEPIVTPGSDYREVTASGELTLDTFFLKLIGMNQLVASATSTAIEGVCDIEVSLVLDISGSMGFELVETAADGTESTPTMVDPDTGVTRAVTRMDRLQDGATTYVETLLNSGNDDKISISLVAYSEQVNIGQGIYENLNTNDLHNYSTCVQFSAADFVGTNLDITKTYDQEQHVQMNPDYNSSGYMTPAITEPVCPFYDYEAIVPVSQDTLELTNTIDSLQPRAGTSIYLGLKWGVTLLDPSIKPVLAALDGAEAIDPAFSDRPTQYAADGYTGSTRKYLVLMTDGQNSRSNRLRPEHYDTPSEIAHWANENFWYFIATDTGWDSSSNWRTQVQTPALGDQYMASMCTAAKAKDIIVYTISLGSSDDPTADQHGWDQMEACASTPNFFFKTSGTELVQIFEDIAEQITDLRLTL